MVLAGDVALDNAKDEGYDSGDGESCYAYEYIIPGAQTDIYRAMIDAALGDQKQ